jgi:hypothetical protein
MTIYAPFALYFMRHVARATTPFLIARTVLLLGVAAPTIEYSAQMTKDKYYWPIVRGIFKDLKNNEQKRQQMFVDISQVSKVAAGIANPD